MTRLLLALAAAVTGIGCNGGKSEATVAGQVLLDNEPLAGASVQLWPTKDDLTLGVAYSDGVTDDQGRFRLKSRDGHTVKPGRYVVLVRRLVNSDGSLPRDEELKKADPMRVWKNSLPEPYGDKERTPLSSVEVRPGHNDLAPFELKSKP
jgi:hypothetical protein